LGSLLKGGYVLLFQSAHKISVGRFCFIKNKSAIERGSFVGKSLISFYIDDKQKRRLEEICSISCIDLEILFGIFIEKVIKEEKIPTSILGNTFYSEKNIGNLKKIIFDIENGNTKLVEHDLIEE